MRIAIPWKRLEDKRLQLDVDAVSAIKLQNRKNFCVSAYNDGAARTNFLTWNLPAIYVIENNRKLINYVRITEKVKFFSLPYDNRIYTVTITIFSGSNRLQLPFTCSYSQLLDLIAKKSKCPIKNTLLPVFSFILWRMEPFLSFSQTLQNPIPLKYIGSRIYPKRLK